MRLIERIWYGRRRALAWPLLPLAALFWLASSLRRHAYRRGLLPSERLPVPVIVVGNLTVGGTGQTPLVIGLARHLAARHHVPDQLGFLAVQVQVHPQVMGRAPPLPLQFDRPPPAPCLPCSFRRKN